MPSTPQLPHYAVIGNPVSHSRSPRIHALFAAATGQQIVYDRLPAPLDGFAATVRAFRAAGGLGLSVTVPFKLECLALADVASARAGWAGAANTLAWHDDHWYADNTDGAGLLNDFARNLAIDIKGHEVLILGAGGAARGILGPLLAHAPHSLTIVNRTHDKAVALASLFAPSAAEPASVLAVPVAELRGRKFDLVINSTSASLTPADAGHPHGVSPWPDGLFAPGALAYDLMYATEPTSFLRWAAGQGAARCADGLGMLVEQAALQFELWRGVLPATAPVLAQLRAEIRA